VVAYRFGEFVLDLVRGTLATANGKDVPLRHKSFRLLRLIVENAGRLLERDAITQAIWPGLTVADDGITQCVRDIRRAVRGPASTSKTSDGSTGAPVATAATASSVKLPAKTPSLRSIACSASKSRA
jgi:hypothetical protein